MTKYDSQEFYNFDYPFDEEFINFLVFHLYQDMITSCEYGKSMYEKIGDVKALMIYAFAENFWMIKFSPKTLSELLLKLSLETDTKIRCGLMLLISGYYCGKDYKGEKINARGEDIVIPDEGKHLYYLLASFEVHWAPYAFRKLAEYKEAGGIKEEADEIFYKLVAYNGKHEILKSYNLEKPDRIALSYRVAALNNFIKLLPTKTMSSERPVDVSFDTFCNEYIFEIHQTSHDLKRYITSGTHLEYLF